ncbi:MAG: hypothetical protein AABX04_07755 [Nanoarchaeota archaeon]
MFETKMAQKITSWEEYENRKRQRRVEVPENLESLETLLDSSSKRTKSKPQVEVTRVGSGMVVMIGLSRASDRQDAFHQAAELTIRTYFSDTITDLIQYEISLAKRNEGILDEENRVILYTKFTEELKFINETSMVVPLEEKIPLLDTLFNYYFLPRLPEQVAVLQQVVRELEDKKYLTRRAAKNLVTLLYPEKKMVFSSTFSTAEAKVSVAVPLADTLVKEESAAMLDSDIESSRVYLTTTLRLPLTAVEKIAKNFSQRELSDFYDDLSGIVGEEYASSLIQKNPEMLGYPLSYKGKYLDTVKEILGELRAHSLRKPKLSKTLGLFIDTLPQYSDLDSVLALKQRVFQSTRTFVQLGANGQNQPEIDIDEYKDKLLVRAGVHVRVARAMTEGKTLGFIGEVYVPQEYFRKNTHAKMNRDSACDLHFGECFDTFVKARAIIRKPKGNPTYRFNPDINSINNSYLKEYMRLALHGEKIIRQEGHLTLNPELVKEFYG